MTNKPSALTLSAMAGGNFRGRSHHELLPPPNNPRRRSNRSPRISHHPRSIPTPSKRFGSVSSAQSSPRSRGTRAGAPGVILGERSSRSPGVPGAFQTSVRNHQALAAGEGKGLTQPSVTVPAPDRQNSHLQPFISANDPAPPSQVRDGQMTAQAA